MFMKILFVSATKHEILPLLIYLDKSATSISENEFLLGSLHVSYLITGVGSLHTSCALSMALNNTCYDLVINLGIGGAFDKNVLLGSVFNVNVDKFGDLGVELADESFSDIFEIGLMNKNSYPYLDGLLKLQNPYNVNLPEAKGFTVNKVTGSLKSISKLDGIYSPDLESMEGAGFAYTVLMYKVNAIQLRAISNHVEPRNKSNWNIPLAIKNLNEVAINILNGLT